MTFLWREPPCGSNPAVKNCSAAEFLAAYMIAEGAQHVCVCVWMRDGFVNYLACSKCPSPTPVKLHSTCCSMLFHHVVHFELQQLLVTC